MALLSFTKKIDYGLLLLAELARFGKDKIVSTDLLVKNTDVPRAFAAQIGKDLVKAGVLGSKEGRGGGYFLTDEPKNISLLRAMEAVDGQVELVECVLHKDGKCPSGFKCDHRFFMRKLNKEVRSLFGGYNLADLI